jgi:hypothetical protein
MEALQHHRLQKAGEKSRTSKKQEFQSPQALLVTGPPLSSL